MVCDRQLPGKLQSDKVFIRMKAAGKEQVFSVISSCFFFSVTSSIWTAHLEKGHRPILRAVPGSLLHLFSAQPCATLLGVARTSHPAAFAWGFPPSPGSEDTPCFLQGPYLCSGGTMDPKDTTEPRSLALPPLILSITPFPCWALPSQDYFSPLAPNSLLVSDSRDWM